MTVNYPSTPVAEVYSPATGPGQSGTWAATKALDQARYRFTLSSVAGGVLAVGGRFRGGGAPLAQAGAYDFGALVVSDALVAEGDAGTTSATFTVSLPAPSADTVTVDYATADASATAGSDYTATSGRLSFAPGQVARTVAVAVAGDTAIEGDETFALDVSASIGADVYAGQGTATIVSDDFAPGLFHALPSERIFPLPNTSGTLEAAESADVQVTGRGGVPATGVSGWRFRSPSPTPTTPAF